MSNTQKIAEGQQKDCYAVKLKFFSFKAMKAAYVKGQLEQEHFERIAQTKVRAVVLEALWLEVKVYLPLHPGKPPSSDYCYRIGKYYQGCAKATIDISTELPLAA